MRRNLLTAHHLAERLRWCQEHIRRRHAQWRTNIFFDEFRFVLFRADGRSLIYRRHDERHVADCVLEHDRIGGGVVEWAGIPP